MRQSRQTKSLPNDKSNVRSVKSPAFLLNVQNSNTGQLPAPLCVSAPAVQNAGQEKLPVDDFSSTKGQQPVLMTSMQTLNANVANTNQQQSSTLNFPFVNHQSAQQSALACASTSDMQTTGQQPASMAVIPMPNMNIMQNQQQFMGQSGFNSGFSLQELMQPEQMMFMSRFFNSMFNAYGSLGGPSNTQMTVYQQNASHSKEEIPLDKIVPTFSVGESPESSSEGRSHSASFQSTDDDPIAKEDSSDGSSSAIRTRPFEKNSTPVKRRKLEGRLYEEYDPTLTVSSITKGFVEKTITTVIPLESDKNFQMYNIVRRLQRDDCVIPFYFRCEVCEKIFYAHTVQNHRILSTHFNKCNGPVTFDRSTLQQFADELLSIGSEVGMFDLSKNVFPTKISEENIGQVLMKLRKQSEQQEDNNE